MGFGWYEGRPLRPELTPAEPDEKPQNLPPDFSEDAYLAANPDIAAAVVSGQFPSGGEHWLRFGLREGRPLRVDIRPAEPDEKPQEPSLVTSGGDHVVPKPGPVVPHFVYLERRKPDSQTTVDLFRDRWASDLAPLLGVAGTGDARLFTDSPLPAAAAEALGHRGRLSGMTVLELGPLEGAHTYALEQLGAKSIVAVEANAEAYLKCLIVKELLSLSARFLFGDVVRFLEDGDARYDLIFCSGILYHMEDPLRLIELICSATDRCFVWSHYYDAERHPPALFQPTTVERSGMTVTHWTHTYGDRGANFWGGIDLSAVWLERECLLNAFKHFGLDQVHIIEDTRDHPHGAAMSFTAQRASRAPSHEQASSLKRA
jgi:hypothetical protein